jgi:hypothetical protein
MVTLSSDGFRPRHSLALSSVNPAPLSLKSECRNTSWLRFPSPVLLARVPINIIPRHLRFLCFHILTHSFAPPEMLSSINSISSSLFAQNTGVVYPPSFSSLFLFRALSFRYNSLPAFLEENA